MNKSGVNADGLEPLRGHRTALILLFLAYTLSITDRMILSVLFPDIKAEFDLSDTQLGILGGISFALFYATLGLPIARLADRYNRKLIILASLVVFSLMTAVSGLAAGFITLLLFRICVGIGEAGVNPASHSIIADYFPPNRRAFAMSFLSVGANLGIIIGFAGGAIIAEVYGWRAALFAVGIPGLLLALFFWFLLHEPPRGSFEQKAPAPPPMFTAIRTLWGNNALRHMMIGSVLMGISTYGLSQWMPTFFMRVHDVPQSQAGILMAGVFGILGAVGALVAGKWFDHLSKRGFQYALWMLAIVPVIGWPFAVMGFLATDLTTAIAFLAVFALLGNIFLGPTIAMIQTLSPVNMRAVASAMKMLLLNLIGYGLGPLLVGVLSDALHSSYGVRAIGISLALATVFKLWASIHFWLCARAIGRADSTSSEPP